MALTQFKRAFSLRKVYSNVCVRIGFSNAATNEVIIERKDSIGIIKLNRPQDRNCIQQSMINKITVTLDEWRKDNNLLLIILKAADSEFFSVGGAAESFVKLTKEEQYSRNYFAESYKFMYKFCTLDVPTVALVNGVMASSGATLAANCTFRVVTEKAGFKQPEVMYGFIPDDGASYFLSREPGRLGFYLALTGQEVSKRDLVKAGIATHFVPSSALDALEKSLLSSKLDQKPVSRVGRILDKHHQQWKKDFAEEFCFKSNIGRMNIAFESKTIEEIMKQLEKDPSPFARKTLEQMRVASPTSLKVTLELLKRSEKSTLRSCLEREFHVSLKMVETHDFKEGIRARLIDKDGKPIWKPARPEEISQADVAAFFKKESAMNFDLSSK